MDVRAVKVALAGMLGSMLMINPDTGLPYASPSPLTGHKVLAYAEAPMALPEDSLPAWVTFIGQGAYPVPPDQSQDRLAKETRDFDLCLFVCIAQSGYNGEAERRAEPYIDAARDLIQSHPLIYDGNISDIVPGIMRAYLVKDAGLEVMPYSDAEVQYLGPHFVLRVEGLNKVTYGNE